MRKNPFVPDQYYHLYNRGVNKERIFFQQQNWHYFLNRVKHYFITDYADLIAYCLMPNHYHLLVYNKSTDFGKNVMHPLIISYTKAIKFQENRSGHLFQGPFQAQHVERNEYLLHLSRYIHMNPVAARLVRSPDDWEFSSYCAYISKIEADFLKPEIILEQFPTTEAYRDFVCEPFETDFTFPKHLWLDK